MKILLIGLIALFLTSCAGVREIESVKVAVAKTPLNLEQPTPIETLDVEWYVINENNYKEVFDKITADGRKPVLFALTDKGYEALSVNYADLRKHILAQHEIIIQYKEYYEPVESDK
jgi:hypothetical protein